DVAHRRSLQGAGCVKHLPELSALGGLPPAPPAPIPRCGGGRSFAAWLPGPSHSALPRVYGLRTLHPRSPLCGGFNADKRSPAKFHKPGAAALCDQLVQKGSGNLVGLTESVDVEYTGSRHRAFPFARSRSYPLKGFSRSGQSVTPRQLAIGNFSGCNCRPELKPSSPAT